MARKIIALLLFIPVFILTFPVNSASATTAGSYYATQMTTSYYNGKNSGSFTKVFNNHDFVAGDMTGAEVYQDLCFTFPSLAITAGTSYYHLSFFVRAPQPIATDMNSPASAPLAGSFDDIAKNTVYNDYMTQSVANANGKMYWTFTHDVAGVIDSNRGETNRICFKGAWLDATNASWQVSQPRLNVYYSYDQMSYDVLNQILNKLNNGITANVDNSDVVGSVDNVDNTLKEQQKKEEEQRKEDEKKADDASNNSQSSSDDSQSKLDDESANLFQVLTSFVGAITGAGPSSCNITGNFGFFNVGNINLCSGASKIRPITTIVGTVMLVGLIIPAIISLLHRFVSLYNEVMD